MRRSLEKHTYMNDINNYRHAFGLYLEAGWPNVLPLPAQQKLPPPSGYTGRDGNTPTMEQYLTWAKTETGNLALRVPDGIIGIDIDAYRDKPGAQTWQMLELELGHIRDMTWISTSRDDGISGIRFYQIPKGLKWPGELGPGIETVLWTHRYAVVWPSIHPEGSQYRWINPNGVTTSQPPHINELPHLPTNWVQHFTKMLPDDTPAIQRHDQQAIADIIAKSKTTGHACAQVQTLDAQFQDMLEGDKGSRHDKALKLTLQLCSLGAKGHKGVKDTLEIWEHLFTNIIGIDRPGTAQQEWHSLLNGAWKRIIDDEPEPCLGHECNLNNYKLDITETLTDQTTEDKTTWEPINLEPIFTGDRQPEQPTILTREDNKHLLYPGKVHSIYGEPESGKSFIIQYLAAQLVMDNQPVLYIDCESDEYTLTDRLKRFGVTQQQLQHFTYIRPERSWAGSVKEHEAWQQLLTQTFTLAVIDGVTEALTMFGFETNDNDGITKFNRLIPRRIARQTNAATVLIDHVAKNTLRTRFAIGGQAKLAAIDGAAYLVDIVDPIAIGTTGTLKLHITKDRPGQIRGHCWKDPEAPNRMQLAAVITINSEHPTHTEVTINAPMRDDGTGTLQPSTQKIHLAIEALLNTETRVTKQHIEDVLKPLGYSKAVVRKQLDVMERDGYVDVRTKEKNGQPRGVLLLKTVNQLPGFD